MPKRDMPHTEPDVSEWTKEVQVNIADVAEVPGHLRKAIRKSFETFHSRKPKHTDRAKVGIFSNTSVTRITVPYRTYGGVAFDIYSCLPTDPEYLAEVVTDVYHLIRKRYEDYPQWKEAQKIGSE